MKKIKVGVVPAAGMGRRMSSLPLTRILPKGLIPILNKPIIEHVIDNLKAMGVEDLFIVVGFKKELFKEYFGNGSDFGVNITYVLQPTPIGIAAAVELTRDYIREPFVIALSDDLTIAASLDNLINDFWTKKAKIVEGAVFEKDVEKLRQACCLRLNNDGEIIDIIEKPTNPTSQVRGCGIYVCNPDLFDFIAKTPFSPPRNEKEITNTIKLVAQEHCAYGSFIDGVNININKMDDLLEAMHLLMEQEKAL